MALPLNPWPLNLEYKLNFWSNTSLNQPSTIISSKSAYKVSINFLLVLSAGGITGAFGFVLICFTILEPSF